jgi:hypothetical protein
MRSRTRKICTVGAWLFLMGMASCNLNKIDYSEDDSDNVQNETASDAYFEDVTDLSTTAVSVPDDTKNGREDGRKIFKIIDNRFTCAEVALDIDALNTFFVPRGLITVDFKTGCTDDRGNTRRGKIMIQYNGRRFLKGSYVTTTFDGYEINGIRVEGTHTATNTADSNEGEPSFTTTLVGGKLTWPDGTTAERDFSYTRTWLRTTDGQKDEWYVTGSSTGTNRRQNSFSVTIDEKLKYQKACLTRHQKFLPSQGKETLIVNNKRVGIDFGAGSCDQVVTISINRKSKQVDLSTNNQ